MMRPVPWSLIAKHAPQARADKLIITAPTADEWFMDSEERGYVGLKCSERRVGLRLLYVFPEWRKFGVGASLMHDVIAYAGGRQIDTNCDLHLVAFYEKFGFVKVSPHHPSGRSWNLRRPPTGSG